MSIAVDSVTTGGSYSGTSKSFSHTCSGSNLILVVILQLNSAGASVSVKYNDVSMTLGASNTSGLGLKTFYLVNPLTGSNNVVITNSTTTVGYQAISFSGANTVNPVDITGSTEYDSTPSITLTTGYNNTYIVHSIVSGNDSSVSPSSSQTEISNFVAGGRRMASCYKLITTAGSTNLSYNIGGSSQTLAIGFREYVAPPTSIKSINGLAYNSVKSFNGLAKASIKNINGLA